MLVSGGWHLGERSFILLCALKQRIGHRRLKTIIFNQFHISKFQLTALATHLKCSTGGREAPPLLFLLPAGLPVKNFPTKTRKEGKNKRFKIMREEISMNRPCLEAGATVPGVLPEGWELSTAPNAVGTGSGTWLGTCWVGGTTGWAWEHKNRKQRQGGDETGWDREEKPNAGRIKRKK